MAEATIMLEEKLGLFPPAAYFSISDTD